MLSCCCFNAVTAPGAPGWMEYLDLVGVIFPPVTIVVLLAVVGLMLVEDVVCWTHSRGSRVALYGSCPSRDLIDA
jgi:hypothetical protein